MHLPVGTSLQGGRYKITRFIASGGFGCTYEADYASFNKRVAIKEFFMKDFCNRGKTSYEISVATDSKKELVEKLKKKFIEESHVLFDMQHPGIVRVIDSFEENGTAYYVMDYVEGVSLHELVKQKGKLSEAEAIGYIRQVCEALRYVHSKNRLHLDIKPGNIMVNQEGRAILIDFGASKHYSEENGENTSTLMGVNTPGYAPYEQSLRSFTHFSPSADIYALGATLYKLLTGITPPEAGLLAEGEATLSPLPNSVSIPTAQAIEQAMQPKRANRPQSIDEFLKILEKGNPVKSTYQTGSIANDKTLHDSELQKDKPLVNRDERGQKQKPVQKTSSNGGNIRWIDYQKLINEDNDGFTKIDFIVYGDRTKKKRWWLIFIPGVNLIFLFICIINMLTSPIRLMVNNMRLHRLCSKAYDIEYTGNLHRIIRNAKGLYGICMWDIPFTYRRMVILNTIYNCIERCSENIFVVTDKRNRMGIYNIEKKVWILPCTNVEIEVLPDSILVVDNAGNRSQYLLNGYRIVK